MTHASFANADKKYLKKHEAYNDGRDKVIKLYFSLITEGVLGKILDFFDENPNCTMRMFSENNLVCVELRIKA